MAIERTLTIIKPSAVQKRAIGKILTAFELKGLNVVRAKVVKLTAAQCKTLYSTHKIQFFFDQLIEYMTSGPVFLAVIEGENCTQLIRDLMGPTDPTHAPAHTIRAKYGEDILKN